jgi:hypothetical protein
VLTAIRFSSSSSPPSSSQALADLAAFHAYATAENNEWGLGTANKWVSFGGSYPGMLAGWSRLKYPELIHAAVASSAPVHAKLDMREYNDITAEVRSSSFFSPCPVDPPPPLTWSALLLLLLLAVCCVRLAMIFPRLVFSELACQNASMRRNTI